MTKNMGYLMYLTFVLTLNGCTSFGSSINFEKANNSGVQGDSISLKTYSKSDQCTIDNQSTHDKSAVAIAVAAPIITAAGKLAVDWYFEQQKRNVERIIKASEASYSITTLLSPAQLHDTKCILITRSLKNEGASTNTKNVTDTSEEQLVALIRVNDVGSIKAGSDLETNVLTFTPTNVKVKSSIAWTRKVEKPTIGISIGISLKAIGKQQSDLMRLLPTGEDAINVGDVFLGEGSDYKCGNECRPSDLLPYPTKNGKISLTVSIVEKGFTGFDKDEALTEITALKEALGPAFSDAIKTKLGD